MNARRLLALGLVVGLAYPFGISGLAEAARKYYPPGFSPPPDPGTQPPAPAQPVHSEPTIIIQPGPKQVIIKTVPGPIKIIAPPRPKPRDPLAILMEERRYYDALRLVEARLKKTPNSLTLQLMRAQLLRQEGQTIPAVEQFNAILSKNRSKSVKATAWNGIGWAWYEKAAQDKRRGNRRELRSSLESSESAFRSATQLLPGFAYAWAGLGRIQLLANRVNDAEAPIKKAMELTPNSLPIQLAQAELLLARGKSQDALQLLYGVKKTTTAEPDVFFLLARASMDTGRIDDAIINLKQLLQMEPDHTEALKLLSRAYVMKMKPQDAEETLETAIALDPADLRSAEGLLKIYDERGDSEHGVLLLKNLLKSRPEQGEYIQALLARLNRAERWEESYQEGARLLPGLLRVSPEPDTAMPVVFLFSRSVFQKGRALLDRRALLREPAVDMARRYLLAHWQRLTQLGASATGSALLQDRLALLYLDPLANLPPLPEQFQPASRDLGTALEAAFLAGESERRRQLLGLAQNAEDRFAIARRLADIGDYAGADRLMPASQNPALPEISALRENLAAIRAEAQDHRMALSLLSKKTSDPYWQKMAASALRSGWGDYETHAMLAKILDKKNLPAVSLYHAQLAARYARTEKEKNYWLRQVNKRQGHLAKGST